MMIYTYQKSKKRKLTKKQLQEQQDFIASINKIPPPSGGKYSAAPKKVQSKPLIPYKVTREVKHAPSLPDTHKGALTKTGIMKDYHKLTPSDREIVADVASCTAPLHKGNYVYVTEGMNPASLGRKNEVL